MREGTGFTLCALALCEEGARLLGHVCEGTGVTLRALALCEEAARLLHDRLLNRLDDCRTCVSMRRRRAATRHGGGVGGCASRDGRSTDSRHNVHEVRERLLELVDLVAHVRQVEMGHHGFALELLVTKLEVGDHLEHQLDLVFVAHLARKRRGTLTWKRSEQQACEGESSNG